MSQNEREELDMAVPTSFDAMSSYYRENLKKILNSSSTISSCESLSSMDSIKREEKNKIDDDGSSTASDSDMEDCSQICTSAAQVAKVNDNESSPCALSSSNLQNKLHNINSVSINNSTGVHFGNKTFYNGPVTIKQIVINEEYLKRRDDGVSNRAFEGSSTNVNVDRNACDNAESKQKENKGSEMTVQSASDRVNIKQLVIAHKKLALALITALCALVATLSIMFIIFHSEDDEPPVLITRDEWQAKQPKEALTKLDLPVNRIIIAHTVGDECFSKEDCTKIVQDIQDMHMFTAAFNFSDIAYNFLIGGDGLVFEGRGWKEQGAHTSGYNRGSIGVAYIGTFMTKVPSDMQLDAGFRLFREGVNVGALVDDYRIYGASQLRTTESPGHAFFDLIKTWSHWSEEIIS